MDIGLLAGMHHPGGPQYRPSLRFGRGSTNFLFKLFQEWQQSHHREESQANAVSSFWSDIVDDYFTVLPAWAKDGRGQNSWRFVFVGFS